MAENTGISWADHTINFWWGCQKVSPACEHCYAERLDARFHAKAAAMGGPEPHWGPNALRLLRVEAAAQEAFRYQRRAVKEGRRFRVFTNSMSDFFEDRRDLDEARYCALSTMYETPNLDWLVLTKRPEQILKLLLRIYSSEGVCRESPFGLWLGRWIHGKGAPANVWLGATAESQEWADKRVPELLKVPAAVRFLSCEPMLGPVDLGRWMASTKVPCKSCGESFWLHEADPCRHKDEYGAWTLACPSCGHCRCKIYISPGSEDLRGGHSYTLDFPKEMVRKKIGRFTHVDPRFNPRPLLDWVIAGGESGPHARPMHPDWARSLRDQCAEAGVQFHFKQWGEWAPWVNEDHYTHCGEEKHAHAWLDRDGKRAGYCWIVDDDGSWSNHTGEPPTEPELAPGADYFALLESVAVMGRHGTKAAGRLLDGMLHDAVPGVP